MEYVGYLMKENSQNDIMVFHHTLGNHTEVETVRRRHMRLTQRRLVLNENPFNEVIKNGRLRNNRLSKTLRSNKAERRANYEIGKASKSLKQFSSDS